MKILCLVLILFSFRSFAQTAAQCHLVEGIYANSSRPLTDLKFETLVDIFTINNAKTIAMNLDGEELRLLRTDIEVTRQTRMIYILKKKNKAVRAAHIMLDRTPREVTKDKEFYGNMILSSEIPTDSESTVMMSGKNDVFNFYCRI